MYCDDFTKDPNEINSSLSLSMGDLKYELAVIARVTWLQGLSNTGPRLRFENNYFSPLIRKIKKKQSWF